MAIVWSPGWGFFGHERINRLAVFTLPGDMIGFYKKNIDYLSEASVNPDRRRYAIPEEAPRHYIDMDDYDSAAGPLPKYWKQAMEKFGEDSLNAHGIVPWHIVHVFGQLRNAMMLGDPDRILRYSAELGHYVADANVPLHTTLNYNGQLTGQTGIHGLWESRLPELFFDRYDFYCGQASYVHDPQQAAWDAVNQAHAYVGVVLSDEKFLAEHSGSSKFNFETKGKQTVKVYSESYSRKYHEKLVGMVERQMRASIKMVGDLWFTAWVDAGQPDLNRLIDYKPTEAELQARREELKKWTEGNLKGRGHE